MIGKILKKTSDQTLDRILHDQERFLRNTHVIDQLDPLTTV
jgi:hypothetical protein